MEAVYTIEAGVRENLGKIKRYCRSLCGRDELMQEELVGNVLYKIARYGDKFDGLSGRKGFMAWVYRICVNGHIDLIRYKASRDKLRYLSLEVGSGEGEEVALEGVESSFDGALEDLQEIELVLAYVKERVSEKYYLVYFDVIQGFSYKETAEKFNVPVGSVKGIVNSCRKVAGEYHE